MIKYGIVGNREGWNKQFILDYLKKQGIKKSDVIISGGAYGVSSFVEEFAKKLGCRLIVYKPDMQVQFPYRFHQRNKQIAKECDILIAFDKKIHSGTSQTIRFAMELGKKVKVINNEEKSEEDKN